MEKSQIEKELLREREKQQASKSEVKFLEETENEDKENNYFGQAHSEQSEPVKQQFNNWVPSDSISNSKQHCSSSKFVFSSTSSAFGSSMSSIVSPPTPKHLPKKKWSEMEFDPVDREMELIVDKLVSSPLVEGKHIEDKE